MKIAFIGLRHFPHQFSGVSGIELRSEKVIKYLSNKHLIYVFVRNWINNKDSQKNLPIKNVVIKPIFSLKNKYLDTFIYSFIASIIVSFLNVDLIFYEGTNSTFFCFIPKMFGKKIVSTVHSLEWKRKKWGKVAKLILLTSELFAIIFSNRIISVSASIYNYLLKYYKKTSLLIPYYFEENKPQKINLINKKYYIKSNQFILFLGRFTPEKRIEWIIKAFKHYNGNKKLVLSGGKTLDINYFHYIRNLIDKDKRIIFTNYVFGKEKLELLSNCSFLILPSQLEGSSLVVQEALSFGKNIIISDVDNASSLLPNYCVFNTNNYSEFEYKFLSLANSEKIIKIRFNKNIAIDKKTFYHRYEAIIQLFK